MTKDERWQQYLKDNVPDIAWSDEYLKANKAVTIKYLCGHSTTVTPGNLKSRGDKLLCSVCTGKGKIGSDTEWQNYLKMHVPAVTFSSPYTDSGRPVLIRYSCNHEISTTPHSIRSSKSSVTCLQCKQPSRTPTDREWQAYIKTHATTIVSSSPYVHGREPVTITYTCGHSTTVTPVDLKSGGNKVICRICDLTQNKKPSTFAEEVKVLAPTLELLTPYVSYKKEVLVKSSECGHTWSIQPNNFLSNGTGNVCRICFPSGVSKAELALGDFLQRFVEIERNNRTIIKPQELDIVIPSLRTAIEFNGVYWHSEDKKGENFHLQKTLDCAKAGYELIHVWGHLWNKSEHLVKSRLRSKLGLNYVIGARKCTVLELDKTPMKFLEDNHLQGSVGAKHSFGLLYSNELVSVMTFGTPRYSKITDYELIRYCSLDGITIAGGASKLLKAFRSKYLGSIVSYSDKSWGTGNVYTQLDFTLHNTSKPQYFYAKNNTIISRYQAQKHNLSTLIPEHYDPEKTEKEMMKNAGYNRCYNCGTDTFILN